MEVKIKSMSIKVFEKTRKDGTKEDFSTMELDELLSMKERVAKAIGTNPLNVTVTFTGKK